MPKRYHVDETAIATMCGPVVYFAWQFPGAIPGLRYLHSYWTETNLPLASFTLEELLFAFMHYTSRIPNLAPVNSYKRVWTMYHDFEGDVHRFINDIVAPCCSDVPVNARVLFLDSLARFIDACCDQDIAEVDFEDPCNRIELCDVDVCICRIVFPVVNQRHMSNDIFASFAAIHDQLHADDKFIWTQIKMARLRHECKHETPVHHVPSQDVEEVQEVQRKDSVLNVWEGVPEWNDSPSSSQALTQELAESKAAANAEAEGDETEDEDFFGSNEPLDACELFRDRTQGQTQQTIEETLFSISPLD